MNDLIKMALTDRLRSFDYMNDDCPACLVEIIDFVNRALRAAGVSLQFTLIQNADLWATVILEATDDE